MSRVEHIDVSEYIPYHSEFTAYYTACLYILGGHVIENLLTVSGSQCIISDNYNMMSDRVLAQLTEYFRDFECGVCIIGGKMQVTR